MVYSGVVFLASRSRQTLALISSSHFIPVTHWKLLFNFVNMVKLI